MKIFLITDIHYGENTNYPAIGGPDYINAYGGEFDSYVPKIKELIASHDLVINVGDPIQDKDIETDIKNYTKALECLTAGKPLKNVIGNHDRRFLSAEQLCEITGEKKLYYSFDQANYHHVVLYAARTEYPGPFRMGQEQLAWLTKDIEETNLPILVYCHFPLDDQDTSGNSYFTVHPDRVFPLEKNQVRKILEKSGKVLAVFCGHMHANNKELINKIPYYTIASFSENDGTHKPTTHCVSVDITREDVSVTTHSLSFEK